MLGLVVTDLSFVESYHFDHHEEATMSYCDLGSAFCLDLLNSTNAAALKFEPLLGFFSSFGYTEMIALGVIALLLFGSRLPEVARNFGQTYRQLRSKVDEFQREFETGNAKTASPSSRRIVRPRKRKIGLFLSRQSLRPRPLRMMTRPPFLQIVVADRSLQLEGMRFDVKRMPESELAF